MSLRRRHYFLKRRNAYTSKTHTHINKERERDGEGERGKLASCSGKLSTFPLTLNRLRRPCTNLTSPLTLIVSSFL
jgi:hypothetical protein